MGPGERGRKAGKAENTGRAQRRKEKIGTPEGVIKRGGPKDEQTVAWLSSRGTRRRESWSSEHGGGRTLFVCVCPPRAINVSQHRYTALLQRYTRSPSGALPSARPGLIPELLFSHTISPHCLLNSSCIPQSRLLFVCVVGVIVCWLLGPSHHTHASLRHTCGDLHSAHPDTHKVRSRTCHVSKATRCTETRPHRPVSSIHKVSSKPCYNSYSRGTIRAAICDHSIQTVTDQSR